MNEIRPHHGFEGISHGGEIYGNSSLKSRESRESEYLELVKLALQVSLENIPNAHERAKEILKYAKTKYSDVLDNIIEEDSYIQGDGSEIKDALDGMVMDDDLETVFNSSQSKSQEKKQGFDEISKKMKQAQEELSQTLEWAKKQPNVPKSVSLGGNYIDDLPEWTKDKGISGYTEVSFEEIKKGIVSQKGKPQLPPTDINKEKDELINKIISKMLNAGEFSNSGLDIIAKMNDIKYVKEKLNAKSIDELQILLASYQNSDERELSNGGRSR